MSIRAPQERQLRTVKRRRGVLFLNLRAALAKPTSSLLKVPAEEQSVVNLLDRRECFLHFLNGFPHRPQVPSRSVPLTGSPET
jgi:hypothetical protein